MEIAYDEVAWAEVLVVELHCIVLVIMLLHDGDVVRILLNNNPINNLRQHTDGECMEEYRHNTYNTPYQRKTTSIPTQNSILEQLSRHPIDPTTLQHRNLSEQFAICDKPMEAARPFSPKLGKWERRCMTLYTIGIIGWGDFPEKCVGAVGDSLPRKKESFRLLFSS